MLELTQKKLKEILHYDPDTGIFTRLKTTGSRALIGMEVGTLCSTGYLKVSINCKPFFLHRLAYLFMEGEMPNFIDHINHAPADNRWSNLRNCSHRENLSNRGKQANNTSGFKGVSWCKNRNKWEGHITVNRKKCFLGYFDDLIEAAKKYNKSAIEFHGEFAYLNEVPE